MPNSVGGGKVHVTHGAIFRVQHRAFSVPAARRAVGRLRAVETLGIIRLPRPAAFLELAIRKVALVRATARRRGLARDEIKNEIFLVQLGIFGFVVRVPAGRTYAKTRFPSIFPVFTGQFSFKSPEPSFASRVKVGVALPGIPCPWRSRHKAKCPDWAFRADLAFSGRLSDAWGRTMKAILH